MEKLIELLNEFETPKSWVVFKSYDNYDGTFYWVDCDGETEIAWSDSLICSKKFWFIEWLVENEKIDLYRLPIRLEEYYQSTEAVGYITDDETILLMELAIQDEPISFLCSLLK